MVATAGNSELKKGSAELLILSLIESRPRHGYELARLIENRSGGALRFNAASLYPLLFRMEQAGWVDGKWVEKADSRRRRLYKLTAAGKKRLAEQRNAWDTFVRAISRVTGTDHA
jgi:PadR family transcriptional regulator PadR